MPVLDRKQLLALADVRPNNRDVYVREREGRTEVCTRTGYRQFAFWAPAGEQKGLHVRSIDAKLPRSSLVRGTHNWVWIANATVAATPALLTESQRIAVMRGGGKAAAGAQDLYKPLAKAVAGLGITGLHAGGPRAKVLSGERDVATALCIACAQRVSHLQAAGEDKKIASLKKLLGKRADHATMWRAANAVPYGTDTEKRSADEKESPALQALRGAVGCMNAGSQSCSTYVTKVLVRSVKAVSDDEGADAAKTFVVELDELLMRHEFLAAYAKYIDDDAITAVERVLWRGADAKGFPAWWLVRIARGDYGLLGKLGPRWTWTRADRDNAIATVPDTLFAKAVEVAVPRDT